MKDQLTNLQNRFYENEYAQLMRTGSVSKYWQYIHQIMEKPFNNGKYVNILEVGAGEGEHFNSVKCEFEKYVATDIRVPRLEKVFQSNPKVEVKEADALGLPFNSEIFDRVLVTCVLVHLSDPIKSIDELFRVTKKGGFITIYLPCEPGFMLRLARTFTTRRKARRQGIENIRTLHFMEHINYYLSINEFLHFCARENNSTIRKKYYPFPFLSWNWNLFKIYQIQK